MSNGPDAGVHDAVGAGDAARERQLRAVRVVVVDARVELRLGRARLVKAGYGCVPVQTSGDRRESVPVGRGSGSCV